MFSFPFPSWPSPAVVGPRHTRTRPSTIPSAPSNLLLPQFQLQPSCSKRIFGSGGCAQCPGKPAGCQKQAGTDGATECVPGRGQQLCSQGMCQARHSHGDGFLGPPPFEVMGTSKVPALALRIWGLCAPGIDGTVGNATTPYLWQLGTFHPKLPQKAAQDLAREPSLLQAIIPIIFFPLNLFPNLQGSHPPSPRSLLPCCPGQFPGKAVPKPSPCSERASQASPCSS